MNASAHILVVDDDRHVLEDVGAALQPPYRVLTAGTSFEAGARGA